MSSFWQRAIVSFTLGPIGLIAIYYGNWFYFIPVVALLLAATLEYSRIMRHLGWKPVVWVLLPTSLLIWIDAFFTDFEYLNAILFLALFAVMVDALWAYERQERDHVTGDWLVTIGGIMLMGWLTAHFFRIRLLDPTPGFGWTALAIVATWTADMGAYSFGRLWGRRKLVPRLSPKKTVVGYVAGILCSALLTFLFALGFNLDDAWKGALLGLLVGTVTPAGDLAISLLKREAGVKDSGHLFPGHGGALDRIDSLVWGVTITYYLILYTS